MRPPAPAALTSRFVMRRWLLLFSSAGGSRSRTPVFFRVFIEEEFVVSALPESRRDCKSWPAALPESRRDCKSWPALGGGLRFSITSSLGTLSARLLCEPCYATVAWVREELRRDARVEAATPVFWVHEAQGPV